MSVVIGWDIGGAHLKAARAEGGRVTTVAQYASPLRSGTERLLQAFAEAKRELGGADRHVVTMTGELADIFSCRADGVERLADLAESELGGVLIYAGPAGYVAAKSARDYHAKIASANWHAEATLIARKREHALLIDLGSTTTDIVPIVRGKTVARGYTDAQRLAAGELVYTGMVRGFVMATADRTPFHGAWTPLVNENFATMADIHRILGALPPDVDLMPTADGRPKTIDASRARLARMLGADACDGNDENWMLVARWFAEAQLRSICDAASLVLSAGTLPSTTTIVAAGIGRLLVDEIARRLHCVCIGFDELCDVAPEARIAACRCAPAVALAALASS
jgi:probable H4MPT-linked C1 transfer pathway protein